MFFFRINNVSDFWLFVVLMIVLLPLVIYQQPEYLWPLVCRLLRYVPIAFVVLSLLWAVGVPLPEILEYPVRTVWQIVGDLLKQKGGGQ